MPTKKPIKNAKHAWFTQPTDRLAVFHDELNEKVLRLAVNRVLDPRVPLVKEGEQLDGVKRHRDIKLALILVNMINPLESLTAREEAVLRGISSDTLAKHKDEFRRELHSTFRPI